MSSATQAAEVLHAISADGTPIACWASGDGPPLIVVHGATADHTRWRSVLPLLEEHATVYAMDRRGRGGSGDHADYAIDREFEDVAAVVRTVAESTGMRVDLLGHSFGAICALGSAGLLGEELGHLIAYEPPLGSGGHDLVPGIVDRLESLLAQQRPDEVIEVFFREQVKVPEQELDVLRGLPAWQGRVAAAHTIPRELRAVADFQPSPNWLDAITVPTLLLAGGDSPAQAKAAIDLLSSTLHTARVEVMPGQQHVAMDTASDLFARVVTQFCSDRSPAQRP